MAQLTANGKILMVASMEAAVQFVWAVKDALMTPYLEMLGQLDITTSLMVWASTPIFGFFVPIIMSYCGPWLVTTRLGKDKTFIAIGCVLQILGMILISFVRDIEHMETHSWFTPPDIYWNVEFIFVGGCWAMDLSKSLIEGSVVSMMVDLCQGDQAKIKKSVGWFTVFGALGSIGGSAASSCSNLHRILPFTHTRYCNATCANLKTCYIIDMFFLGITTYMAFKYVSLPTISEHDRGEDESHLPCLTYLTKGMKKPYIYLYMASSLTMLAWFPFEVFGSDWVGKVYGGASSSMLYMAGVREAALGLMAHFIVVGVICLVFEPLTKAIGGLKRAWGICIMVLAGSMMASVVLSDKADQARRRSDTLTYPPMLIRIGTLIFFGVMGIPKAATLCLPSLLISSYVDNDATSPNRLKDVVTGLINIANALSDVLALVLYFRYPVFLVGAVAAGLSNLLIFIFVTPSYA